MVAAVRERMPSTDQRAVLHHQLEGAGEQEVADQNRGLVAEYRIGRGQSSPQQARVNHVVVEQRGGVDELDAGRELHMPLASVAAEAGAGEGEQRAQSLAAGGDDVCGELRDQRHRAIHAGDDGAVAGLQIGLEQGDQSGQRALGSRGTRLQARRRRRIGPGRTDDLVQAGLLACMSGRTRHHIGAPETGSSKGGRDSKL